MEKKALGRGLAALLSGSEATASAVDQAMSLIPVTKIRPNRFQPRQTFDEQALQELAESIRQHGMLQPILVRRTGDGLYELIAGERRFRAAKLANLSAVPASVRHSKEDESTLLALIENIQRSDLNPLDEARAYRRLSDEFGLTQEAVAERVGRDRASVANLCRILSLPREVQDMVESRQLTLGHAKVILGLKNVESQLSAARRIVRDQLSVRQSEQWIKRGDRSSRNPKPSSKSSVTADLEDRLRKRLGTKVVIRSKKQGGEVILRYYSDAEFTRIADVILS